MEDIECTNCGEVYNRLMWHVCPICGNIDIESIKIWKEA